MFDQAFDAAQTRCADKYFRFGGDRHRRFASAFRFERKHAAEHRHLLGGDFVAGMRTQSRIMHAFHLSMLGEGVRDFCRVFGMRAHAPRQRPHSAQNQPAIEG